MTDGPLPPLTAVQRKKILTAAARNKKLGYVKIMRKAGLEGTGGELHALLDEHFKAEIREARGQNIAAVEDVIYTVALDKDHPQWSRAVALLVKAHGGAEYRDDLRRLEHTGRDGGPIELVAGTFDPDRLTLEELETLKELAAKAQPEITDGNG